MNRGAIDGITGRPGFKLLVLAAIALVTAVVYLPSLSNGFVRYDDLVYLLENGDVLKGLTGDGFFWAFSTLHSGNWHPLTWLSHMLDVQIFGLDPFGHHLTNLLLHVANTTLLAWFLIRSTGRIAAGSFVALLFALHPLHVESVAWVAERKDLLSTFFFLLTILAYSEYVTGRKRWFMAAIVLFALGLMAKPMLVSLPIVLLILDYWPLKRLTSDKFIPLPSKRLLIEKLPFAALAAASSVITFIAQDNAQAVNSLESTSTMLNAGNAIISYCRYLASTAWPTSLAVLYPFDQDYITVSRVLVSAVFLVTVTLIACRFRKSSPFFLAGWLWYLATLLPVIGFLRVGAHSHANRYTYIPLIGIFIIIAWGASKGIERLRVNIAVPYAASTIIIVILAVATRSELQYWKDPFTLFNRTLSITRDNWVIQNDLGAALFHSGKSAEAIDHLLEALRIRPTHVPALQNLGVAYMARQDFRSAFDALEQAVKLDPTHLNSVYYLGQAALAIGNLPVAETSLTRLKQLDTSAAEALESSINFKRSSIINNSQK